MLFLAIESSGIQNTVVYVIMNGFNRPELSAFGADNSRPTIANRQFVISGMTLRQKLPVFFMDIAGFAARLSDRGQPSAQGHIQGYIEEEHGVRFGQAPSCEIQNLPASQDTTSEKTHHLF